MPVRWKKVSSLSWTILCPRKVIYLYIQAATSELRMMSAFSSVFQVPVKPHWVLSVTENLSVMTSTSGLTKESSTSKEDVMPNVSTSAKINNQKSSKLSDSVLFCKTSLSVQPKRSIISILLSLKTLELVILFNLFRILKFQQLLDTQRTLFS